MYMYILHLEYCYDNYSAHSFPTADKLLGLEGLPSWNASQLQKSLHHFEPIPDNDKYYTNKNRTDSSQIEHHLVCVCTCVWVGGIRKGCQLNPLIVFLTTEGAVGTPVHILRPKANVKLATRVPNLQW